MMSAWQFGLRCHDIGAALAPADIEVAGLGLEPLLATADAAGLAVAVRGRGAVADAHALGAGRDAVELLERTGLVELVDTSGGEVVSFIERVPDHRELYETLGQAWLEDGADGFALGATRLVHHLAEGPAPVDTLTEELGISARDVPDLLEVLSACGLVRSVATPGGALLYSPLLAAERPGAVTGVLKTHGPEGIDGELRAVEQRQGTVVGRGHAPLDQAAGLGLVPVVALSEAGGVERAFAVVPGGDALDVAIERKAVLERATALLACCRAAQEDGLVDDEGAGAVLAALAGYEGPAGGRAPGGERSVLERLGLIGWHRGRPRLVPTADNREALALARRWLGPPVGAPADPETCAGVVGRPGRLASAVHWAHRHQGTGSPDPGYVRAVSVLAGRRRLAHAFDDVAAR